MESKVLGDDNKVAVQVKSYGWILGDKEDRLKRRAAEPFDGTFPEVRFSPSRNTFTSSSEP
jgi:hypothetical protein